MNASPTDERRFHDLVSAFVAETVGHGERPEPGGMLEFGYGDLLARAFLLARAGGLLMVEVELPDVLPESDPARADALLALHRLNEAARFEHGWTATIDDADLVVLHRILPIGALGPEDFRALFDDGLARAASLQRILSDVADAADAAERDGEAAEPTILFRG
jgi:hypothetical protein